MVYKFIISTFLFGAIHAQYTDPPTFAPSMQQTVEVTTKFDQTDLPNCGNGVCDEGENCLSCPVDCVSGTTGGFECGNGVCEDGETCFTCSKDCAGDGAEFCCSGGPDTSFTDTVVSCTDERCGLNECDTEASPLVAYCCGDDTCGGLETEMNCAVDGCVELCGNGSCEVEEGENTSTCPVDCHCNFDGICDPHELIDNCELDCTCGNLICDVDLGENVENCPSDCACNANYKCEPWETENVCLKDCGEGADFNGGAGHDGEDGNDGIDQQTDGSDGTNGEEGDESEDDESDSDSSDDICGDSLTDCQGHGDCCSNACDNYKCVG